MPPVRSKKASASPAYPNDFAFGSPQPAPSVQPNPHLIPYASPVHDASSSVPPKKKRSHGKTRPAGYIPRPPNAFIIFRTEYIKSMDSLSTPEMSKNLGNKWKQMSKLEKEPWKEKSRIAAAKHKEQHPNYKYKPVHPRDAEGRCIRKPRKPNQPRVKNNTDGLQHLPASISWMEGKSGAEFPHVALPSDASSVSSPPRSPSPAPSASLAQPAYQMYRRSSSVPLPSSNGNFFFDVFPQPSGSAYPPSPGGPHTGHVSRRPSKRPSTSMDFACAGPIEPYSHNSAYLTFQGDSSQWRPMHRRSISAPMFGGDIPAAQFPSLPSYEFPQAANPLTPINPAFSNVFDKFSWDTTPSAPYTTIVPPVHPYTGLDIPSMTHSPSNGSATPPATTPDVSPSSPSHHPAIQHPAPVSTFDFSVFQAHMSEFDAVPQADPGIAQEGLSNALEFAPQPYQNSQLYLDEAGQTQATDQQFYPIEHQPPVQYSEERQLSPAGTPYSHAADINGYEEGLRYTEATRPLDINDLIVEGY